MLSERRNPVNVRIVIREKASEGALACGDPRMQVKTQQLQHGDISARGI
jgi:hypothetical protein